MHDSHTAFAAMAALLAAALLSALLIIALGPWLARYAMAEPNARSSHKLPTPQGGGIAVIGAAIVVSGVALFFSRPSVNLSSLVVISAAVLLIAAIGALADKRPIAAAPRLVLQSCAVAAVLATLPSELRLLPVLPWWSERILLFVGTLWFVNLVNFMDGLDWMTVAEAVPITLALGVYSFVEDQISGRARTFRSPHCCTLGQGDGGLPLRSLLTCVFAVGAVFLLGGPVWAETDSLMRALGFALTGSDDADLKVIDRANCVFAIKNELFRLNNVYTDRIEIQGWQKQRLGVLEQGVTVTLRGDEIIFEKTVEPPKDDGSELIRQMRVESPEMFKPHHYAYARYELYLPTNDQDGVKRAWQYVYSNGCSGKRAP